MYIHILLSAAFVEYTHIVVCCFRVIVYLNPLHVQDSNKHIIDENVHQVSYLQEKGKEIPLQTWTGPKGSRRLRLPDFKTIGT
jgi:hypothetical protein